ncbi:MAG: hypothetical protein ABH822_00435 [Patescibacteria group bacterium]
MRKLYFKNLRLEMGAGGRFVVRLVSYIFYGSLAAACFVMLFAELEFMRSAGVFLLLFLMDRLIHIDKAEEPLAHMPDEGRINLDIYLAPSALAVLEKAVEKTYLLGGSFSQWMARQCLTRPEIKSDLRKFGVRWQDVDKKAKEIIKQEQKNKEVKRATKKETLLLAEKLAKTAYRLAVLKNNKYIDVGNLFAALDNCSVVGLDNGD